MFQNPEKKNKASPNSMLLNDVKADNKKLPPQIGNEAINQLISAEGGGNNGEGNTIIGHRLLSCWICNNMTFDSKNHNE